ncbi:MAG TPA: STAS/SEC14 domain-containing protein [Gemmatimonadaceae bacterium]|nr:STAS/SEC14 domain-containing protein [Gemmatimonadaceae bacterium]
MPVAYELDTRRKLLLVRGTGLVTAPELMEVQRALRDREDLDREWRALLDLSSVEDLAGSSEDISSITALSNARRLARVAVVAARDAAYGLARVYQARVAHGEIAVFRKREEALEWLGMPDPDDASSHPLPTG